MSRKTALLLISLALVAVTLAGCGKGGGGSTPGQYYTVSGTVTTEAGQPIPDVEIVYEGISVRGTDTVKPDGTWSLTNLKGQVTIRASSPGWSFKPEKYVVSGPRDDLDFKGQEIVAGKLSGRIVTREGFPVEDMLVTMGDYSTRTDGNGVFEFAELRAGNYVLVGQGGALKHYVIEPQEIVLQEGKDIELGVISAHPVNGQLVVNKSLAAPLGSFKGLKYIKTALTASRIADSFSLNAMSMPAAASPEVVFDNETYFVIRWDSILGAASYTIQFLGEDMTASDGPVVWSSQISRPNDPSFDPAEPTAFLDLDDELSGLDLEVGKTYYFRVVSPIGQYAPIGITFGKYLTGFPEEVTVASDDVSWETVDGAAGYRVVVYRDNAVEWESPIISDNMIALPAGLSPGTFYYCMVQACFTDSSGWTREITSNVTGFVYQ